MAQPADWAEPRPLPPMGAFQRAGTAIGLSVSTFLCLSCALIFLVSQIWLPRASLPFGFAMQLCVDTTPTYIEASFSSPYISSFAPPPSAVCLYTPWLPALPQRTHILRIPI